MALPDTGANITAMSPQTLKQSGNVYLPGPAVSPKSADGSRFKTLGTAMFQVCHKNMSTIEEVFIIDGLEKPILSRDVLKVFKLIPANFPFAEVNEVNKARHFMCSTPKCQTLCQSKDTTHSSSKEDRQVLTGYKGQRTLQC